MPKCKERTKAFRDLRVRFRLSGYDFHADVAKHYAKLRAELAEIYRRVAPTRNVNTAKSATGFLAMRGTLLWRTTVLRRS